MTHETLVTTLTINAQLEQAKEHLVNLGQSQRGYDCLSDEEYQTIQDTYVAAAQRRIDTLNQELQKL